MPADTVNDDKIEKLKERRKEIYRDGSKFFRFIQGVRPYDKQAHIMNDKSKNLAARKGRQVGSTTVFSTKLGRRALTAPSIAHRHRPFTGVIVGTAEDQAIWALDKFRKPLRNSPMSHRIKVDNQRYLELDNGARIFARPAGNTAKSNRGLSADVVLFTEAAYIPDSVFDAVIPMTFQTNGRVWMESSTKGTSGKFYRVFDDESFQTYQMPSTECRGISDDKIEQWRRTETRESFQREVLGEFIPGGSTYFPSELIKETLGVPRYGPGTVKENHQYFLGVDPSRYGDDQTVFIVLERPLGENKIWVKEVISTGRKATTDTMGRIISLDDKYDFEEIAVDEGSMGGGVIDRLDEKNIGVTAVRFGKQNKHEMYETLKLQMEQGNLTIPDHRDNTMGAQNRDNFEARDLRQIYKQMDELLKDYYSDGYLKISHPDNGFDDFPDALALATMMAANTRIKSNDDGSSFSFL